MKKKSTITAEQIESSLAAFCEELSKPQVPVDVVPAGWFTVAQLAEKWGKSECTTGERLRRMINTGKVERNYFSVQLQQIVRRTPHYRLKK